MLTKMPTEEKQKTEPSHVNTKFFAGVVVLFAVLGLAGGYTIFPILQSPKVLTLSSNMTNNTTSNITNPSVKHSTKYTTSSGQNTNQNSTQNTKNKTTSKSNISTQSKGMVQNNNKNISN